MSKKWRGRREGAAHVGDEKWENKRRRRRNQQPKGVKEAVWQAHDRSHEEPMQAPRGRPQRPATRQGKPARGRARGHSKAQRERAGGPQARRAGLGASPSVRGVRSGHERGGRAWAR